MRGICVGRIAIIIYMETSVRTISESAGAVHYIRYQLYRPVCVTAGYVLGAVFGVLISPTTFGGSLVSIGIAATVFHLTLTRFILPPVIKTKKGS